MNVLDLKKFCERYQKLYIYGTGIRACFMASALERLGYVYEAFLLSDDRKYSVSKLYNHDIFHLSEVQIDQKVGIMLGLGEKNMLEVKTLLAQKGVNAYYWDCDGYLDEGILTVQTVDYRCRQAEEYISQPNIKLGVFLCDCHKSLEGTYRYRIYNFSQMAEECGSSWKFVYFFADELDRLEQYFSGIKTITLVKMKWTVEVNDFLNFAKEHHITIIYDMDDLLFDLQYVMQPLNNVTYRYTEELYQNIFGLIARNCLLCNMADSYTTTNSYLAKKIITKFQRPCQVIKNSINDEQMIYAKRLLSEKKRNCKKFVIGYFSGSYSHRNDFQICAEEIKKLMTDYDDIILRLVGYIDVPVEFEEFVLEDRIDHRPPTDFLTLQRLISEVDVNLAPLDINEFTNSKSELKFFEAAIVKTITCASPTYVYKACIKDNVNGFLCEKGEWYKKIQAIYLKTVPVENISNQAYAYVQENYTKENISIDLEKAYEEIYSVACCP